MAEEQGMVAIAGAGHMGTQVARALSHCSPLIYDIAPHRARQVAKEVGGWATCQMETLALARTIVLVLPPWETVPFAQRLVPLLGEGTLLVNVATEVMKEDIWAALPPEQRAHIELAAVKFVAGAPAMEYGIEAVVVVDADNAATQRQLLHLFRHFGLVMVGEEKMVRRINILASEEGLRAALRIERTLEAEGVPKPVIKIAIKSIVAGVVQQYARGEKGVMSGRILERLLKEEFPP